MTIRRALISVSDKAGIAEFAKSLTDFGVEIISTGGTLKALRDSGVRAISISDVTGFPEILDGRVKTLHPKIHGGLLAVSDNAHHRKQLEEFQISPIDMVIVNLYPFEQTAAKTGIPFDEVIEQIDIGGPALLRSTAKNFKFKTVIVNPEEYGTVLSEMKQHDGAISEDTRFRLAKNVFYHTARYDSIIFDYLSHCGKEKNLIGLPEVFSISLPKSQELRYGENPHQHAALYGDFHGFFETLHGKELSYNNIVDIHAAAELIEEFSEPTAVIIKHTNPCGVGCGKTLAEAYDKALATDTKSAFGGIVAVNKTLDMPTAQLIDKIFTEVIIAPSYDTGVLDFLKRKKDRRLIRQVKSLRSRNQLIIKYVAGGLLAQTPDDIDLIPDRMHVVSKRKPTDEEHTAMHFAWQVAKNVKSNAIVYAKRDRTIG
ncbi:MAG TPA: bifunctional phosphoribosylaminoimidazolecarboxamide formyltransferase/IMP cyclohydrolase, partial [Bacteroidota bacterium]|nr:bifunctional phosphoribosylaminoimidazolecarboxamide formyltransferase/IMP cyclohydrolase [Bacteroidota bacterium]